VAAAAAAASVPPAGPPTVSIGDDPNPAFWANFNSQAPEVQVNRAVPQSAMGCTPGAQTATPRRSRSGSSRGRSGSSGDDVAQRNKAAVERALQAASAQPPPPSPPAAAPAAGSLDLSKAFAQAVARSGASSSAPARHRKGSLGGTGQEGAKAKRTPAQAAPKGAKQPEVIGLRPAPSEVKAVAKAAARAPRRPRAVGDRPQAADAKPAGNGAAVRGRTPAQPSAGTPAAQAKPKPQPLGLVSNDGSWWQTPGWGDGRG